MSEAVIMISGFGFTFTHAMTCMYSANLPRNSVRVAGSWRMMIWVIPSTMSAGRETPRLLKDTGDMKTVNSMHIQYTLYNTIWVVLR